MVEEKLKENHFYTLDKTFLLIGNICSQFCGEKTLFKRVGKLALKVSKNLNQNSPQMAHFIGLQKLAVGA